MRMREATETRAGWAGGEEQGKRREGNETAGEERSKEGNIRGETDVWDAIGPHCWYDSLSPHWRSYRPAISAPAALLQRTAKRSAVPGLHCLAGLLLEITSAFVSTGFILRWALVICQAKVWRDFPAALLLLWTRPPPLSCTLWNALGKTWQWRNFFEGNWVVLTFQKYTGSSILWWQTLFCFACDDICSAVLAA